MFEVSKFKKSARKSHQEFILSIVSSMMGIREWCVSKLNLDKKSYLCEN